MTCCGHVLTRREWMWSAVLGSAGTVVGAGRSARAEAQAATEPSTAAMAVLRDNVSVDVHTHGGPDGITSQATTGPSDEIPRSMRAGRIGRASCRERV